MGFQLGRAREFVRRNIVLFVMIPTLIGLHYGWQKVQEIEIYVPKHERKDLPVVQGAKYIQEELRNKLGLKKE